MMFDKIKYWKNRKAGKRGQGVEPSPVVKVTAPQDYKPAKKNPTKKAIKKATKRSDIKR